MQVTSEAGRTRIGLVSTEPIRLEGFHSAFEDHASILIVVGDLDTLLADSSLNYLILDLSYDFQWMAVQSRVKRMRPDIHQILVGPSCDEELVLKSIAAGGRAYLDSNCGPLKVRQAVESVIQGSIWAPRRVLSKLIDQLLEQNAVADQETVPSFSPRERQVLDLIMTARSNREICVGAGYRGAHGEGLRSKLDAEDGNGQPSVAIGAGHPSVDARPLAAAVLG
jgi:DNA-binding NarL/FixJ family response regulator